MLSFHSLSLSLSDLLNEKYNVKSALGDQPILKKSISSSDEIEKKTYKINTCHFPRPQIT